MSMFVIFLAYTGCDPKETGNGGNDTIPQDTEKVETGRAELKTGKVEPNEVSGGKFPPSKPKERNPNEGYEMPPIPEGPKRGDMKPANQAFNISQVEVRGEKNEKMDDGAEKRAAALSFKKYRDLTNSQSATINCCPEISVAENGETVMLTGNYWMALSKDGGNTFTSTNPSTIFPEVDNGFCCDQVLQYVPEIDMFIWLIQYWPKDGKNRIRMAAQFTDQVRSSNGTAWTYWDFPESFFTSTSRLDRNDMSYGNSSLWWATNVVGEGRVVLRMPLSQIQAKSTINFSYTNNEPDCMFGIVSQNGTNTVYWAGHKNNSTLKVYSMKDGDGFYSWRDVNIDSWPDGALASDCPDKQDWLDFASWMRFMFGGVVVDNHLYFSWMGAKGGGFPQVHCQIAKIRLSDWKKVDQFQIWNENLVFGFPHMDVNSQGELGLSVAFGGPDTYASSGVGVWGDYVIYYPKLSNRCTSRWGDYNTVRTARNGRDWVAGGYVNTTNSSGSNIVMPHYILFGR